MILRLALIILLCIYTEISSSVPLTTQFDKDIVSSCKKAEPEQLNATPAPSSDGKKAADAPQKLGYFARTGLLIKTYFKNFNATGTIAPTSSSTINELLKPLRARDKNKPVHILEVGFGEGCITREIMKELGAHDSYCGVELDENLFKPVAEECKGDRREFFCGAIETCEFPENHQFDFIISTVPLSTIPTEPVKNILTKEHELLKPQGTISYIAYWFSFKIMGAFNFFKGTESSKSYDEKMDFLTKWRNNFTWTEANVVLNLPPACVFHGVKTH